MKALQVLSLVMILVSMVSAREYHVSVNGRDSNAGTSAQPFATISKAAEVAQAGDVILIYKGTYRERVTPPRGGASDTERIVYRAAPGGKVVLKGSEIIKGWEKVQNDTWKVTIPNDFFGDFNPYSDLIAGDWFNGKGREHHTGAVYLSGHWLTEAATLDEVMKAADDTPLWFAQVDETDTTIWAQFEDTNPNEAEVEINVRRTVFYPATPGINYLTVRGFTMMHAATNWAPPTAEQVGLIGTHWSKGWIIEDCDIRYSTCVGVTLGKHGDQWDNTSADTAEGYVKTIERAIERGWSKENIGHHIVRNNEISHCEQAGLVGSLGAVFSTISHNDIHDIHIRQLFTGAEMAGIKIHAAIDCEISRNHIYRTCRGIWLDWMNQGSRVTRNLLHDNNTCEDLFVEVNHGPFLVDNNIFLSRRSLLDVSQGGAYAHNLFAGGIVQHPELNRETPYHQAHSAQVAGLLKIEGGDDRFYNNIFVGPSGLTAYDKAARPVCAAGNVYLNGAKPHADETNSVVRTTLDPAIRVDEDDNAVTLYITVDPSWQLPNATLVTTERLGLAAVTKVAYENADGTPLAIDTDYFGKRRDTSAPCPGPFANPSVGQLTLRVW